MESYSWLWENMQLPPTDLYNSPLRPRRENTSTVGWGASPEGWYHQVEEGPTIAPPRAQSLALLITCLPETSPTALPCWEGGCPFLLPWGIHMTHSKVLGDLLHILKVEECVETGFIYKIKIPISDKLYIYLHFSSAQSMPYHSSQWPENN